MNFGGSGRNEVKKGVFIPYYIDHYGDVYLGVDGDTKEFIDVTEDGPITLMSGSVDNLGEYRTSDNVSDTILRIYAMRVSQEDKEDEEYVKYIEYEEYMDLMWGKKVGNIEKMASVTALNIYISKIFSNK